MSFGSCGSPVSQLTSAGSPGTRETLLSTLPLQGHPLGAAQHHHPPVLHPALRHALPYRVLSQHNALKMDPAAMAIKEEPFPC